MTEPTPLLSKIKKISTHTLCGERDSTVGVGAVFIVEFQLTRSVGSVTVDAMWRGLKMDISTHTRRGERDGYSAALSSLGIISTHTLRGERDQIF